MAMYDSQPSLPAFRFVDAKQLRRANRWTFGALVFLAVGLFGVVGYWASIGR